MASSENSYHLNLLRKINNLSEKYYGNSDERTTYEHDSYLAECNAALCDYFKKSLCERFLFSALSYIAHTNHKAKVTIVKGNDKDTNYNFNDENVIEGLGEFKAELKVALQKVINESGLVSMTNILLDRKNTHDLYLVSDKKYYTDKELRNGEIAPNIFELPLGQINYFDDISLFRRDEVNKRLVKELFEHLRDKSSYAPYFDIMVADYIWHYKRISNAYYKYNRKHFIIYFIRPSILNDKYGYNLLLSLATNEIISETELAIIDLLVYKVVSQMFIEKMKDEEYHNLLTLRSGMGHFLKNRVSQKGNYVTKIENENTSSNERIKENCAKLNTTFSSLFNIGSLFHIISSVTKNNNKSVLGTDLSIQKEWVQKTPIKISELFNELADIIYESKKSQSLTVNIVDNRSLLCSLEIQPYIGGGKYVPVSWIYKEIFYELFYNAGKYSPSNKNVFTIEVELSNKDKWLLLSNAIKDDSIKENSRYQDCIGKWGKIQNNHLSELTGLAFVEEFLEISKLGKLYAKVDLNALCFNIGLELNGLIKIS